MRRIRYLVLFFIAVFQIAAASGGKKKLAVTRRATLGSPSYTRLNINNLSHWFSDDLLSANDPRTGNSGLEFPRGVNSFLATIFIDGLVWGGNVRDGRTPVWRVGGEQYAVGTAAGSIISKGITEDPEAPDVRIYRIRRNYATADLDLDAAELGLDEETVRAQYKTDWLEWPAAKGAPFYDADGDGKYTPGFRRNEEGIETPKLAPRPWEPFDPAIHADEPGLANADQVVWTVANDLDEETTASFAGGPPIGLEIQFTAWAYKEGEALRNTIFKQYQIIYKGAATTPAGATIDSMYVAQWSDPDLGTYSDDFVGVDTTLSLMFAYNSAETDPTYAGFGLPPPASGYDMLQGPLASGAPNETGIWNLKPRSHFTNHGIYSFVFFLPLSPLNEPLLGVYEVALEWKNLFRGFMANSDFNNPTPYTNSITGEPTRFPLAGDPATEQGDLDGIAYPSGDRRMATTWEPFSLALGDTQEVVVATMAALGSDRLGSVSLLKSNDRLIQLLYDGQFWDFRATPPNVKATGLDGKVVLNWGFDPSRVAATESDNVNAHNFEGYNIYQLKNPAPDLTAANAKRIATFDRVDGIKIILERRFDDKLGVIVERPIQFGEDSGIRRTLTLDHDAFRNRPMADHQDFYLAVTAYYTTLDNGDIQGAVESRPAMVTARPQPPAPGARLNSAPGQTLDVIHVGPGDGRVIATVIDPTEITGDDYEVVFEKRSEAGGGRRLRWHLLNNTRGDTVLSNQSKQAADSSDVAFPNAEGLLVQVLAGSEQNPNTLDDAFFFSTKSLEKTTNVETKKSDALSRVNVFPNPYPGIGRLRGSDNGPLVRFTNLPPATTIRIFTLAGTLARRLAPERQEGQTHDWNLRDRFGKRVASGIYLAHVEMPGVGAKVLKLVIVQ